ncbi:hypothetical protein FQZ97_816880 [compost metagenome]
MFEEAMPGYRCIVTRQAEGAINLQFESLASHKAITLPALDPELWDTPEKLKAMCEQITEEFLLFCEEELPEPSERDTASIRVTGVLTERLHAIFQTLNSQKTGR